MKASRSIVSVALVSVILLLTPLLVSTSCNGDTYWFTDPPEIFRTNDVERAQQEIPFTIILPTYLPDDIKPLPYMIEGPVKGTCDEDRVEISIKYFSEGDGYRSIYIDESNRLVTVYPPSDSSSNYLDIAGIQVLEYEASSMVVSSSGTKYIQGFNYAWNSDTVHFNVRIYEYEKDEARKIVESMIE